MASLSGLKSGFFTDIDVIDTISINGDSGTANQVLTSDGSKTSYQDPTLPAVSSLITAGTGITITATGNPETIATNVKQLVLDGSAVSGAPQTFNPNANGGSQTITINDTDTQLNLIEGSGINITTIGAGEKLISAKIDADTLVFNTDTELEVAKVPNALTAGTNISFSSGTTYDGSAAITISSTDTNTQLNLTAGNGIEITNTGGVNRTIAALPSDVFIVSGEKRMTLNLSNFMPNDDIGDFNIASDDSGDSKKHGTIKPLSANLEVVGYFVIPDGFEARAARVDITDGAGSAITRDLTFESFTTYGTPDFDSLGTGTSGTEQTFTTNLAGASDKLLLIKITTTTTADHIRGGYIKLVEV